MKKRHLSIVFSTLLLAFVVVIFNSNITLRFLFENKIWAHKTNNIEKLNNAKDVLKGVELDVVFIKKTENQFFDVNHPPDSSINLSLKEYFQSAPEGSNYKFWLDFKNLKKDNELLSSKKLDSIVNSYKINKANVIVESRSPSFLKSFRNKGFLTSYYLPAKLHELDSRTLKVTIEKIRGNIDLHDNIYISTDYKDYYILKKHFPNRKKILWFTAYGSMNKIEARILLYKILLDKNVDVLLIPFH